MRARSLSTVKDQRCDLEAGQLRALLDHLSSALANPRLVGKARAAQSLEEHTPTLDSLRIVVDAVHRIARARRRASLTRLLLAGAGIAVLAVAAGLYVSGRTPADEVTGKDGAPALRIPR